MSIDRTSLGTMIRAARLGWRKSDRHGAFIRISDWRDHRGSYHLVELCPINSVPSKKIGFFRCWWEGGYEVLDMIPWLRMVRKAKTYIAVIVDDEGKPVPKV